MGTFLAFLLKANPLAYIALARTISTSRSSKDITISVLNKNCLALTGKTL